MHQRVHSTKRCKVIHTSGWRNIRSATCCHIVRCTKLFARTELHSSWHQTGEIAAWPQWWTEKRWFGPVHMNRTLHGPHSAAFPFQSQFLFRWTENIFNLLHSTFAVIQGYPHTKLVDPWNLCVLCRSANHRYKRPHPKKPTKKITPVNYTVGVGSGSSFVTQNEHATSVDLREHGARLCDDDDDDDDEWNHPYFSVRYRTPKCIRYRLA